MAEIPRWRAALPRASLGHRSRVIPADLRLDSVRVILLKQAHIRFGPDSRFGTSTGA